MSKLSQLRVRLGALRRRRQGVRWGTAYSAVFIALLLALGSAFLVDFALEMNKAQRLVLLAIVIGAVVWAFRRYALPWLGQSESELDVALWVERQQHIDSDLVAALQFEEQRSAEWGSGQLRTAVVDYVAEFGRSIDVFQGFSRRLFYRRIGILAVLTAVTLGAVILYPAYARAFFNLLLLGSMHYPTRTQIERIVLNGNQIYPAARGSKTPSTPYGEPVKLQVFGGGQLPADGFAELTTLVGHTKTTMPLKPGGDKTTYAGELPRLVDSVSYQVYLGDAWTDPRQINVIHLPSVTVEAQATPPAYAQQSVNPHDAPPGARQIAVIEGSHVALKVRCENKPLTEVQLTIEGKRYPLAKRDKEGRQWQLAESETPLARVVAPVRYEVQVTDADGLHLPEPIIGYVRIKADRKPRVTAAMVTQFVLPTAKPRVGYGAADDYGISKLVLHRQVVRPDGTEREDTVNVPLKGHEKTVTGRLQVDLSTLKVEMGDTVKLTLEAVDYRGEAAGVSATSEPLTLQVTDERGVLAAMSETDQRSARQLDSIIKRQLGTGETP